MTIQCNINLLATQNANQPGFHHLSPLDRDSSGLLLWVLQDVCQEYQFAITQIFLNNHALTDL